MDFTWLGNKDSNLDSSKIDIKSKVVIFDFVEIIKFICPKHYVL